MDSLAIWDQVEQLVECKNRIVIARRGQVPQIKQVFAGVSAFSFMNEGKVNVAIARKKSQP